jgi:hypothetical protein
MQQLLKKTSLKMLIAASTATLISIGSGLLVHFKKRN